MPFRTVLKPRLPMALVFLCLGLVTGFSYSLIVPPWQAPDEPGHLEYARLLAEKVRPLTKEDVSPQLQREILSSMHDHDFWRYLDQPDPEQVPDSFRDDPFLVLSGTQVEDEPPLYYLIPALIFALVRPESVLVQLYIMRWFSVLLSSLVVVVAYLTADELFHNDPFLVIGVPMLVASLPMFAFIGASANNDSMAVLLASLVIYCLVRALRRGLSPRSAFVGVLLVLLSVSCKKTTLFTIPLAAIAFPIYAWRHGRTWRPNRRHAIGAACLLCLVLLGAAWQWDGPDADLWVQRPETWMRVRTRAHARSGLHSFHLKDDSTLQTRYLLQVLPADVTEESREKLLTLRAWVRSDGGVQEGYLLIRDSAGDSMVSFNAGEQWALKQITRLVAPGAQSVRVLLGSGRDTNNEHTGDLYFDDVTLSRSMGDATEVSNLLQNSSAEFPALRSVGLVGNLAKHVSISRLLDRDSYSSSNMQQYALYGLLTFAGFWANFGWLTMPLDMIWYQVLAVGSLVALIGLGLWGIDALSSWKQGRASPPTWQNKSLLLLFVGLCLVLLQTFLPMIGRQWQPQGRYLFPAIIPIATLSTLGWRRILAMRWRNPSAIVWVLFFLLFHILCLFGYIIPHYYG
jgi:4-amino-4-deoxy-L-arabinose transferase-like glycosyltransferase